MEQQLQLNRVTEPPKKGERIIILQLTDIQLHSNARLTQSVGGAIRRSIENNKPGRIFSPLEKPTPSDVAKRSMTINLPFLTEDPVLKQTIHDYQQQGYRVMIRMPKVGLPVRLGEDSIQFMKSTKSRRILRRMKKDKDY